MDKKNKTYEFEDSHSLLMDSHNQMRDMASSNKALKRERDKAWSFIKENGLWDKFVFDLSDEPIGSWLDELQNEITESENEG